MTDEVKVSCRGLWKLFGPDAAAFLRSHGPSPAPEELRAAGYIGAVQDVSFEVKAGEILIVMGLSGSGKSTLIRCLTRLTEPTAGQVLFDGEDLLAARPAELIEIRRHKMGMVFQNFGLLPHRSVLSNVAFPLEVQKVDRKEREVRARRILALVGLDGREDYFPRELSGGQQQRVGIARSLAVEPDIWFLDEPFSALDPLIRREMQDEFLKLQTMLRKTIVFITHDFDEATRLADRIGIMKDGRLIQLGTPEAIVTSPADAYVADFAREAPRDRIISVERIMEPLPRNARFDGDGVGAHQKLGDVAARVLEADGPVPVIDEAGRPIGIVTRQSMIDSLFRGPQH